MRNTDLKCELDSLCEKSRLEGGNFVKTRVRNAQTLFPSGSKTVTPERKKQGNLRGYGLRGRRQIGAFRARDLSVPVKRQ